MTLSRRSSLKSLLRVFFKISNIACVNSSIKNKITNTYLKYINKTVLKEILGTRKRYCYKLSIVVNRFEIYVQR